LHEFKYACVYVSIEMTHGLAHKRRNISICKKCK